MGRYSICRLSFPGKTNGRSVGADVVLRRGSDSPRFRSLAISFYPVLEIDAAALHPSFHLCTMGGMGIRGDRRARFPGVDAASLFVTSFPIAHGWKQEMGRSQRPKSRDPIIDDFLNTRHSSNAGNAQSVTIAKFLVQLSSPSYETIMVQYQDTTFGNSGIAITNCGYGMKARSVALQSTGKIIVAGIISDYDTVVGRFNTDGTLDTSFDSDGLMATVV